MSEYSITPYLLRNIILIAIHKSEVGLKLNDDLSRNLVS